MSAFRSPLFVSVSFSVGRQILRRTFSSSSTSSSTLIGIKRPRSPSDPLSSLPPLPPPPPSVPYRRVVVTGIGLVTPLGWGTVRNWKALLAGHHGMVTYTDPSNTTTTTPKNPLPCQVVAKVPRGKRTDDGEFDPSIVIDRQYLRTMSPDYIAFALGATQEALIDAQLLSPSTTPQPNSNPILYYPKERIGVSVGTGIGGIEETGTIANLMHPSAASLEQGVRKISPFFIPRILINMAAGNISIRYGTRGPNISPSTACATGAHAIGDAYNLIRMNKADIMIAGGTESCIGNIALAGFSRAHALTTKYNDQPDKASRPFDKDRDGFILGEGAGILILENYESAIQRQAPIYAEIRGYGLSSDGYHPTIPLEDGSGAYRTMLNAMDDSGIEIKDVQYINAHATSTVKGDTIEAMGIQQFYQQHLPSSSSTSSPSSSYYVSSTKGSIGHLLGAAGAVEAAFTVLALSTEQIPPNRNLDTIDPTLQNHPCIFPTQTVNVPNIRAAVSNSFGFGGTNASLLFAK